MTIKEAPIQQLEKLTHLYQQVNLWATPTLERFGEMEWGKYNFSVRFVLPTAPESEHGWIIKKLRENQHYHIEITSQKHRLLSDFIFFLETGGGSISSNDLSQGSLVKLLNRGLQLGPTHLKPSL